MTTTYKKDDVSYITLMIKCHTVKMTTTPKFYEGQKTIILVATTFVRTSCKGPYVHVQINPL